MFDGRADDRPGGIRGEGSGAPERIQPPPLTVPSGLQHPPRDPIFYADAGECADLQGAAEAVQPLAELCALGETQTPFLVGIVGPSGSGASFALRRLSEAVEGLAAAAAQTADSPFLSRVLVVPIDAAGISGDPACAIASAAFAALERGRAGVSYAAIADEAAHAGADPHSAAAAAAERHDELGKRLESERAARDEVEAKRVRLSEALLYETPGSRIDAFIRASRPSIEARLRRFGLAEGDSGANYRDLVRDLESLGVASRATVAVRSLWTYPSQARWLALAVIAFAAAFCVEQLRGAQAAGWLHGLSASLAPVGDWLAAHDSLLATTVNVAIVLGIIALVLNVWRAFSFSALLFRGLRLLNTDVRERRRELDASAARLNQRVVTLTAEAEAAARHAAAMAARAGGAKPATRAPGPSFVRGADTPARAARSFLVELGRMMSAPTGSSVPAPQRLVFAFDNLDVLPPAEALRFLAAASTMLGPGCVGVVACDPAALAAGSGGDDMARQRMAKFFQVAVNAQTFGLADGGRFAARLLGSNGAAGSAGQIDATRSRLIEPLSQNEAALLTAIAPLAAATPRGVKRFLNAYRLARLSTAPRPAIALMLAVKESGDEAANSAMNAAMSSGDADLPDPAGPSALVEATQAARAASGGAISVADARAASDIARRYTLSD